MIPAQQTRAGMQVTTEIEQSPCRDAPAQWLGRWPHDILADPDGCISIARTEQELREIGALRYELFIERDGKRYSNADHVSRTFLEPIDSVSLNFQARVDGRLLASVRGVRAADAVNDTHLRLLLDAVELEQIETSVICSRLVVRSEHRARSLIGPMFSHVYRTGMRAGARHCILGTRIDLVGVFERFGFRRVGAQIVDPVASDIHLLSIDMHDLAHLHRINSPLFQLAETLLGAPTASSVRISA
jgi:predicted GNAT family N-acyltransferase